MNIIKFFAKQVMTLLEVRSAICLVNEHADLLPPMQQAPSARAQMSDMTSNRLLSLFIDSPFAQFESNTKEQPVYTPPLIIKSTHSRSARSNTPESVDKSVVENILGLANISAGDARSFHDELSRQSHNSKLMTPLSVEEKDMIAEMLFVDSEDEMSGTEDDDQEKDMEVMADMEVMKRPQRPKPLVDIELSEIKMSNDSAITPNSTGNRGKSTPIQRISKNVTELLIKAGKSKGPHHPKRPQAIRHGHSARPPQRPKHHPIQRHTHSDQNARMQRPKRPRPRLHSPQSAEQHAESNPVPRAKAIKPSTRSPQATSVNPRRPGLQVITEPHARTKSGNLLGVNMADVMGSVKKRVSILFSPKEQTTQKQLRSIMEVPSLTYAAIALKSSEQTDPEEEKGIKTSSPKIKFPKKEANQTGSEISECRAIG
eukprot:100512_1